MLDLLDPSYFEDQACDCWDKIKRLVFEALKEKGRSWDGKIDMSDELARSPLLTCQ